MKEQRPLQSDLFATPQPLTQLPALQRAKVLALLQDLALPEDLLTQANGATAEQEKAFQQQEVNHDEDPD